jgi:ankyrin repeat protein
MFSREERLIRAVLDDDAAGMRRLLGRPGIKAMDRKFLRFHADGAGRVCLLHLAAYSNSDDVARLLIDNGEGVNSLNDVGDTPLHVAARYNAWETADLLISRGADLQIPNLAAQTPYDIAVESGNANLVELLRLAAQRTRQ